MKDFLELIKTRRSIRKFLNKKVKLSLIKKAIDSARYAPSAANLQFLEFLVITKKNLKEKIFPHLKWAGYLYPKGTPSEKERPASYIMVLINKYKSQRPDLRDVGAGVQNILLSLHYFGIASCWIAAINKKEIKKILKLPNFLELDSVIALGYPAHKSKVVKFKGSVKYYLDKSGTLCVPKRPLKEILFINEYKRV